MYICLHLIQQILAHLDIHKNVCCKRPLKIIKKYLYKFVSFNYIELFDVATKHVLSLNANYEWLKMNGIFYSYKTIFTTLYNHVKCMHFYILEVNTYNMDHIHNI